MTSPSTSTPFRNLVLAGASTLFFGALVEGVALFLEPPPVQKQEYLWDWSERFKDGDFYTLEKGEGYPPGEETNADGLRDLTRPVESRPGLRRVVVLGDSVAYGHGVLGAEAFPQVLETSLRQSGRDIDVFNIALPGWATRQERIAYERIALKYRPDVVVLAVCLNDLAELQINLTKPPGFLLTLFKHSATVRMALGASRREIGAVEELFSAPHSPRVSRAFQLFFDEARALRDRVTSGGAVFQVVVFPFKFQLEPLAPEPSVQRRLADFAKAEKIALHDFLPVIADQPGSSNLFLDYDHFTPEGHERIAAWLGAQGEISGGSAQRGWSTKSGAPTGKDLQAMLARARDEAEREFVLRRLRTAAPRLVAKSDQTLAVLKAAAVEQAVSDPSPRVRFEAAQAVFDLGLPEIGSVAALVRGVGHADPQVRAFATWTLGEMGESARPALSALVALARMDGGAGRTGALTAIGKIGGDSPETIPLLLQELKHPKEARRYRAARTLSRMGAAAASAVPGLIEALRDPSPLVRLHVARAFGTMGEAGKQALPALIEVLNQDPDPEVKKEVSLTLSRLPGR